MKKLKPFLFPALGAVLGSLLTFAVFSWKPELLGKISNRSVAKTESDFFNEIEKDQRRFFRNFDDFLGPSFLKRGDPFDEMRKMRERMEKQFGFKDRDWSNNPFDMWFQDKFGGGSVEDISKREDSDFVYYDVKVEGVNGTSVQTNVENGYLTITGEIKKKSTNENGDESKGGQFYSSTFKRTFPLPENVDASKMEMTYEKGKFVIKFPKIKV